MTISATRNLTVIHVHTDYMYLIHSGYEVSVYICCDVDSLVHIYNGYFFETLLCHIGPPIEIGLIVISFLASSIYRAPTAHGKQGK